MIEKTGIPTIDQIKKEFPETSVLVKAKAIIECYKEIPCNPCSTSCPFDAIFIPEDINVRPLIDFDACTGCGICVYNCPGLAITVRQIKDGKVLLKVPYEFTPLPNKDEVVNVMNRAGEIITKGLITRVVLTEKQNKTALIHVEIPEEFVYDAMTIEVKHGS
ncbi:4Fe-4S binding protein [Liberiplasma polymorphum]|uniref:4Fe-4S binding protein n=1 Tax=Liberiplasma polymorphum TaxID=3374570 RepID=UPI00377177F9